MKNPRLTCAGGILSAALLLGSATSVGQVVDPLATGPLKAPPAPSLKIGPSDPHAAPVPEWLTWKAFQRSLAFYNRQSPQGVQDLLATRLGVPRASAALVLSAGETYLAELERIDAETRQAINARYRPERAPPVTLTRPSFRSGTEVPLSARASAQPTGASLRDLAIQDGFYAQVEERRAAALAAHKKQIVTIAGSTQLAAMERFVETEVAPHVKVFGPGDLAPAPDRSAAGDVVLQSSAGK